MASFTRMLFMHRNLTSTRSFSMSQLMRMPRAARDRNRVSVVVDEEVDTSEDSRWNTFMKEGVDRETEIKIAAPFGNLRLDRDNIPQFEGQFDPYLKNEEDKRPPEPDKFGYSYTENEVPLKQEPNGQDPESMYFNHDGNIEFRKFKQFKSKNSAKQRKEENNKLENRAQNNIRKTQKSQNYQTEDSKNAIGEELNYFDNLLFKETLDRFDSKKVKDQVEVQPGVYTLQDFQDADLNEVDKQYIGASIIDMGDEKHGYSAIAQNTKESFSGSQDLGYIDQQFFFPNEDSRPTKKGPKNDENLEKRTSDIDTNGNKKESKPKEVHESRQKKRIQKRVSPAMEYVRNLRNQEKIEEKTVKIDPVDQIGVGIMARLSSAALVNTTQSIKKDSRDETADTTMITTEQSRACLQRFLPPDLNKYTSIEVEELLTSKVLYNDHEIVALWKPYGLPMFSQDNNGHAKHSLERYLPFLAKHLGYNNLHEVHRLDQTTTGVLLLATSQARRKHLKQLLAAREIVKTYYLISNGVPSTMEGVINIPIGEGKIGDKFRPTLRPDYAGSKTVSNKRSFRGEVSAASTEFRVLSKHGSAALVECLMLSGVKHQIRLHMGLALGTPILGDSKYSWPDRLGPPQRIKGDILQRLKIKRSHGRQLPIFLHARRVSIPHVLEDARLTITASRPHFFTKAQQKLKLIDREVL